MLKSFRDSLFVVKYGGSFLDEDNLEMQQLVATDIVFLASVGIRVALVHGGGKSILRALAEGGISTRFVNGLRFTDEASIEVVERTLNTEVNEKICQTIEAAGGIPAPTPGHAFSCQRLSTDPSGNSVDLGFVGKIDSSFSLQVKAPLAERRIPVISCIMLMMKATPTTPMQIFCCCSLAASLGARRLVYLCDVPGLWGSQRSVYVTIHSGLDKIDGLKNSGVISSGMIPAVDGAAHAIKEGVKRVHFINANQPHSLLLEIFTHTGIGTEIVLD